MNAEILKFAERLELSMDGSTVHNLVYSIAKESSLNAVPLFRSLYQSLISKEYGPRFGKLVVAIGVGKVKETLLSIYS